MLLAIQQMVQEDTGDTKADLTEWKGSRYCDLDTGYSDCLGKMYIFFLDSFLVKSCNSKLSLWFSDLRRDFVGGRLQGPGAKVIEG